MARSHRPKKPPTRRQPDHSLLTTNDERRLAAAALARRSFEDRPRGPDGRWVEGKLVTLPEPRGDMTDRPTNDLDWAFSGTGPDSDAEPVTLMQPFVPPRDVLSEESVSELPVRAFVERVTPRVPVGDDRPSFFIEQIERQVREENLASWFQIAGRAFIVFLIVAGLAVFAFAVYLKISQHVS